MKKVLLGLFLLGWGIEAQAQANRVSDINPLAGSAYPTWLTGLNNKLVFAATDGVNGAELWALDTALSLQYDLNPGGADGALLMNYKKMAKSGNYIYFSGDNGATGLELYKWDGVNAPSNVYDANPGSGSANVIEVYEMGGRIYFNAYTPANGNELWSYTVSTGYTQRLTDINTGVGSSDPHNFTTYNGKLYFTATSSTLGTELFVYDPVSNTNSNAVDILAGTGSSDPQGLTVINNKLYFSAGTFTYGREIYSYDGTVLSRLTNVDNSFGNGVVDVSAGQTQLQLYNNKIYFAGDNGSSGTQLFQHNLANGVTSMAYAINTSGSSYPQNFYIYAGKIYFSADDGTHGTELWSYNGNGTPVMVADIDTGINSSMPMNMYKWGNKMYFSATTAANGTELYSLLDSAALTVQNIRFNGEVTVYPNPANSAAHIQIKLNNAQQLGYTITDMKGSVVAQSNVTEYATGVHNIDVNMSQMTTGMYLYRVYDAKGVTMATGRIEKQ